MHTLADIHSAPCQSIFVGWMLFFTPMARKVPSTYHSLRFKNFECLFFKKIRLLVLEFARNSAWTWNFFPRRVDHRIKRCQLSSTYGRRHFVTFKAI